MRVAVTGASGFIGGHAVLQLSRAGHKVVAFSRHPSAVAGAAEHLFGDICQPDAWRFADEVDAIVHLAGISDASLSAQRPLEYNMVNAVGTLLGLEAARRRRTRFILASSQRVYRSASWHLAEDNAVDPQDPYGYSKLAAEQWLQMYHRVYGLPATVVRFFSVYGPGQIAGQGASGVVSIFVHRALRGTPLRADRGVFRDFTYVDDAVHGIRLALESPKVAGEVFNIATGQATSVQRLAETVIEVTRSSSTIEIVDGGQRGDSLVANIAKAKHKLGFCPKVSLREGLERYVASIRS